MDHLLSREKEDSLGNVSLKFGSICLVLRDRERDFKKKKERSLKSG
jgi:hypothetical protein